MLLLLWMVSLTVTCHAVREESSSTNRTSTAVALNNTSDERTNSTHASQSQPRQEISRDKRSFAELNDALEELEGKTKRGFETARSRSGVPSWTGKRARPEKKIRFSSWGGKRSEDKRKFNSWGGKRADGLQDWDFNEDKRAKFNSWGGKRAKFSSWGGKRSEFEGPDEKRAKFNSWGGKRDEYEPEDDDYLNELLQQSDDEQPASIEKRVRFQSWGGKRSNDELLNDMIEKRAKFNSWGGKRSTNDTGKEFVLVKRAASRKRKPIFSSWGGKRTARSAQPQLRLLGLSLRDHSWGSALRPIRRGPDFYAWGGKRSV